MPRISLYRPERGQDYEFIDRQVSELFTIGGTDVYLHKYIGTGTGENFKDFTQVQDLLFLENRDRIYDTDIYRVRGHYQVQDIDFNLSQFGLFLDNDMVYMTVHINDFIKIVGRKPLAGDVLELPHLRDDFALNQGDKGLPRFFVIEDVGRAAEGFSMTWWPHLYRLKLKKISDTQQYADILDRPLDENLNYKGEYDQAVTYYPGDVVKYLGILYTCTNETTNNIPTDNNFWEINDSDKLKDILSTYNKDIAISDSIVAEAETNTPYSGYETQQFYTLAVDETTGRPALKTVDESNLDASMTGMDASRIHERPKRSGYTGYLLGDGVPDNGVDFGHGIAFPLNAVEGDYFLRTDFMPNRLFRFDGAKWVKKEDAVRHTLTNTDNRQTQKTGFINNNTTNIINDEEVAERQYLSKALKPKADF